MTVELVEKIYQAHQGSFLTVGITGSVSVGKSTLAENLAHDLEKRGLTVTVVSTDDFLKTNQELQDDGLFDQKGFPVTYHLDQLGAVIEAFRQGEQQQAIPKYSQTLADIVPNEVTQITRPDVLIIEGVVALQLPSVLLDQTIFVEAKITDIKDWYIERMFLATAKASQEPSSWRYQYREMPVADLYALAMEVWEQTNQANYDRFILPTKNKAGWLLKLDRYHQVVDIQANNIEK